LDDNGQPVKNSRRTWSIFTEPSLFDIFDFKWLGRKSGFIKNLNPPSSQKQWLKIFYGDWQFAIGKTIKMEQKDPLKITGILADGPENTDLQLKVVITFGTGSTRSVYKVHKLGRNKYHLWMLCFIAPIISPQHHLIPS
jgi:hypothetical protein